MSPISQQQDVKNVYFAGVHSDVGGGYAPSESGLAKVAFEWMIREAGQCGLDVNQGAFERELQMIGAPPDPCGPLHDSLKGFWWAGEFLPIRRYSWDDKQWHWHWLKGAYNQPRNVLRGATMPYVALHNSVIERFEQGRQLSAGQHSA